MRGEDVRGSYSCVALTIFCSSERKTTMEQKAKCFTLFVQRAIGSSARVMCLCPGGAEVMPWYCAHSPAAVCVHAPCPLPSPGLVQRQPPRAVPGDVGHTEASKEGLGEHMTLVDVAGVVLQAGAQATQPH